MCDHVFTDGLQLDIVHTYPRNYEGKNQLEIGGTQKRSHGTQIGLHQHISTHLYQHISGFIGRIYSDSAHSAA
jgi:hypothetical protein